jgi:hypothetical protein
MLVVKGVSETTQFTYKIYTFSGEYALISTVSVLPIYATIGSIEDLLLFMCFITIGKNNLESYPSFEYSARFVIRFLLIWIFQQ